MARYNELLVGRYNRLIQKLFSMKGPAAMPQVASEVQPVIPFFAGRELRPLESWNSYAATMSVGAVAAQTSGAQIRNPTGSNVIIILESIITLIGGAGEVDWSMAATTADMANAFAGFRLDARQANLNSNAILTFGNNFASLANFVRKRFSTTEVENIGTDIQEWPLAPGDALRFITTVNVSFNIQLQWRERFLEESERSG